MGLSRYRLFSLLDTPEAQSEKHMLGMVRRRKRLTDHPVRWPLQTSSLMVLTVEFKCWLTSEIVTISCPLRHAR